jgi:hypothetical protein
VPRSRRRCHSQSPRRHGRRRRAARHTAARRGSARSKPVAKAADWSAPRRLQWPQRSRGTWSSWSRNRRPPAQMSISPPRCSRFRLLSPPSQSPTNRSRSSRATQPSRPPPQRGVRLRASGFDDPQRLAEPLFSPRKPSNCHRSLSVPGGTSAPTNKQRSQHQRIRRGTPALPIDLRKRSNWLGGGPPRAGYAARVAPRRTDPPPVRLVVLLLLGATGLALVIVGMATGWALIISGFVAVLISLSGAWLIQKRRDKTLR